MSRVIEIGKLLVINDKLFILRINPISHDIPVISCYTCDIQVKLGRNYACGYILSRREWNKPPCDLKNNYNFKTVKSSLFSNLKIIRLYGIEQEKGITG